MPPGIHLCQLPFADDIRALGIGKTLSCLRGQDLCVRARVRQLARLTDPSSLGTVDDDGEFSEDQPAIDKAKKIIKNLTKAYKPDLFPNPGE